MTKKRRVRVKVPVVPDVLWRLFRDRARALSAALTSLLPSPSSLLSRRRDPSAYRNLLRRCFIVVSENSPPPPTIPRLSPQSHWPQREIVARTIEMMISEHSVSSNVLCSGYDKYNQSSPLMEILTGPEWCLLLERVGEEIMAFLLKHTSIFLPLAHKKYHQVAGPPITELCFKRSKVTFEAPISSSLPTGTKNKRGREDDVVPLSKRQQQTGSFDIDGTSSCITSMSNCKVGDSLRLLSCDQEDNKHCQNLEVATQIEKNRTVNAEDDASHELHQNSNESAKNVRKRSRPFLWQRRRKRRQLDLQETAVEASCQIPPAHMNRLPENCNLEDSARFCHKKPTCLERKDPRHVSKRAEVNRKILFYNLEVSSSAFPREHILNSLRPNTRGAMFLLMSIFGINDELASSDMVPGFQHGSCSLPDSDSVSVCLYHSLIDSLKTLIHRAQRCQHSRLLNKHCVVQTQDQNAVCEPENHKENQSQQCKHLKGTDPEDIKSYCQKSQVVSFVWAACRSIVPSALLGTPKNWRRLTRNINKFVQLRRFEKFSLKQCMHRLKISEFPLLSKKLSLCCLGNQVRELQGHNGFGILNLASPVVKQRLVESWIYWFFSHIVVPLLQANFYVTESEHGRQEMFYYTKSVWGKVKKGAITALKDKSYVYLDDATVRDIVKRRRFGFSKLRLLPKGNGMRLLANLKAPSRMPKLDFSQGNELFGGIRRRKRVKKTVEFYHFKAVNSVLRDAHAVLRGMQLKEPEKLGSSVFDYNDVYRKLCPFLIGLKNSSSAIPAVYLIAADVSKAFDSVDQDKLLSVLKDVLRQEKYILKQSSEVRCTNKSLWVRENLVLLDQNINSRFTPVIPCQSTDSILVNQEGRKFVNKGELLFNLNEHVKYNVLQLDKKFYLQRVGICQGSVLSSLLCSLYYGDMDNKVIFPFLKRVSQPRSDYYVQISDCNVTPNNSYTLLRFIDDFLFISTSKDQAESFFSRLSRGFQDYNCYMNEGKYSVNFDISRVLEPPSNRLCVGENGVSFLRWSGLLINCATLEVQADYTKYLNNHLSSTLTVSWQDKPRRRLEQRLCGFMRPKCHPLFYDSNINSGGVVRLNVFQAFVVGAMKFHCYTRDLSYICKLCARSCLSIIENSFRYMHFLIKKRMCSPSLEVSPVLDLGDGEVEWLGLSAYIQVLSRKQSRHKKLVSLLKSKLLVHDLSYSKRSSELDYAVDVSHSALLWKIKY